METEPSTTAMATAVDRGRHRLYDDPPWILDDAFALVLVGPIWHLIERRQAHRYPEAVIRGKIGGVVGRSRYAEDRLTDGDFSQYVILGAGLDTFIWRRPDMKRLVDVFEVDHPASQTWKRERAFDLARPDSPSVTYVPIDFEAETLHEGLASSGFQWTKRTFFSWLGVTMYLTHAAIEATLQTVRDCAPGSEIVFTYAPTDEHLDELGREYNKISDQIVADVGEPVLTRLSRSDAEDLVRGCGLEVAEHPDHDYLVRRYFSSRRDELQPFSSEALITGRAPSKSTVTP